MAPPRSNSSEDARKVTTPDVTIGTFARAAGVANLAVASLVFIEFSIIALVNHDGESFHFALWLVPFVTLVIWCSSAVICAAYFTPRWPGILWRRLIGPVTSSPSDRSELWDDWLDNPEPPDPLATPDRAM